MFEEKRKYPRSEIELAASYGIPEESLLMTQAGVKDASVGGFSFVSDQPMKIGETLQLAVELSDSEQCVVPVTVVWQKNEETTGKYRVGVSIKNPHKAQHQKLISFLQQIPLR